MLKNDKRTCKKLYKYYKKAFNDCNKLLLNSKPNFLFGLETMMLYLQYMQDIILATKSFIAEENVKTKAIFTTIDMALAEYTKYKQSLFNSTLLEKNMAVGDEEKKEQLKKLLKDAGNAWQLMWQTISTTMEGWVLDEHFMK